MSSKDKKWKTEETEESEKKEAKIIEFKIEERKITFDVYFQGLMQNSGGKILAHHKAPMKSYAKASGLKEEETITMFDKVFKNY